LKEKRKAKAMYPDLPTQPFKATEKKKKDLKVMGFCFLFSVKATVLQQNNKRSLVKDNTANPSKCMTLFKDM